MFTVYCTYIGLVFRAKVGKYVFHAWNIGTSGFDAWLWRSPGRWDALDKFGKWANITQQLWLAISLITSIRTGRLIEKPTYL